MMKCNCHCCRVYAECDEGKHPEEEIIWARHYGNGWYYWEDFPKGGNRVKICIACQDFLADNAESA